MRQISLSFSSIEAKKHKIDTEKHDNKDNKRQRFFNSFLKKLSKVVLRCSQKSTTTLTTKDNGSLIPS